MLEEIFESGILLLLLLIVSSPFGYLMAQSLIKANKFVDTFISATYGVLIGFSLFLARLVFLPVDKEAAYTIGTSEFRWAIIILAAILLLAGIARFIPSGD